MFQKLQPLRMAVLGCGLSLALASTALLAQDHSTQAAPDNTARNKAHNTTADQQSQATSDREITAKIRREVVHDKALSTYGHNVKIICQNGAVTLRGPVHSDDEKHAIEVHAANIVGQDKITSRLTVKQ